MQTPAKITVGALLAAAVFSAGRLTSRRSYPSAISDSGAARQALYYSCPMHPQYRSDQPGDCPSCGMRLVPVSAEPNGVSSAAAGAVRVDAARQQLFGIRTAEVSNASASCLLRLPGRVAVDEERLYRLIASADGWVRKLGRNSPGEFVKKKEVLASYYTPNLITATQTFVFAMQTNAQSQSGDAAIGYQRGSTVLSLQVALDNLRSVGMNDLQIEKIRQTRIAPDEVDLYSPADGFVIVRNISPEQRFDKGSEMYRIADLSHVWVMTDVFEKDRDLVKPGAMATVRCDDREFTARMSSALPQLDPQSRTLRARFELDNPNFFLRPGEFVEVEFHAETPAAIAVPADAVVDSGRRQTVFVDSGNGMFQPRQVQTGWRLGDRIEIIKGLEIGERIVVSGAFLVDSESRMKIADAPADHNERAAADAKDPVCGMDVDPHAPGALQMEYAGRTFYFCSEHCRKSFRAQPGSYLPNAMSVQGAPGKRGPA